MQQTPDEVAQRSAELFNQGLYCAESVLQAVAESRGIQSNLIPRIATGLCSGVSRTGGMCGAVSGGVLAINLLFGRDNAGRPVEDNYRVVLAFLRECDREFGSTNCQRLIGCRLDTAEGQQYFRDHKLREKCEHFTREAARLACRSIQEHEFLL